MKIFRKLSKNFQASVVLMVIFTLLFPFSLLAETQYKAPKNSLSYFSENDSETARLEAIADKETDAPAVADPVSIEPAPQATLPEKADEAPLKKQLSTEVLPDETAAISDPEPIVKAEPVKAKPVKPQQKPRMSKPQTSAALVASSDTAPVIDAAPSAVSEPVFSSLLVRMQQNKAKRIAEAEKLGIVLPSQGGDIAMVSPSLSKIQQTLQSIIARQARK